MLFDEIKLPVQKRSKARLELVIETTIHILETQGIEKCTIPHIATIAELPKITIYQYFPTVNHLYTLLVKRYLEELQGYVAFKSERYQTWQTLDIAHDLIRKVAEFYNTHHAASILILGGPVHVEGLNLQEMVIEQISKDLHYIFTHNLNPLQFKKPQQVTYLIEMVFALMKHSFYKYGAITTEVLAECLDLSDLYLKHKGFNIH